MFEGHGAPAAARTVGRYAIFDPIGSGGMAVVHLGRLIGPVGFSRMVAIKRLRSELASDPELTTMLIDEAQLAAHIHHPNVVGMLDVVDEAGEVCLVMEYVHGESLAFLARGLADQGLRLPIRIVANIMAGALHGLHAAHEAVGDGGQPLHIVHRDVSPQNILVGADGTTRVLDFGVAKAASRLSTTRIGQIKGKLRYMAPEQVLSKTIGPWTDVWSACVTFWETLTGKPLFTGDNDLQILKHVLEGEIPSPRKLAPEVPEALAALVLAGLARDPNVRIRSALELARGIEAAVGLVSARDIGDWVRRAGRNRLEARAKRIAELDRSTPRRSVPAGRRLATPIASARDARSERPRPVRRRTGLFATFIALTVAAAGLYLSRAPIPIDGSPAAALGSAGAEALSSPAPLQADGRAPAEHPPVPSPPAASSASTQPSAPAVTQVAPTPTPRSNGRAAVVTRRTAPVAPPADPVPASPPPTAIPADDLPPTAADLF